MKLENFKLQYNPTETKEFGVDDYMLDALAGVPAGLEDMAHGAYNLGDFLSFDTLPDWDEERFFARPKTLAGELSAGIVQYALPFGFIGKGLSKAGKLTKALTKGKKPGKFTDLNVKGYLAADVATNFVAFDGQQERLSNFLKETDSPVLNNAVTEYLAADPDDSELEGRAKNVLEGAMIDAGVGSLFKLFSSGLKASKRYVKELDQGANKEDAVVSATFDYQDGVAAYSDLPDFNPNGPRYVEEFRENVMDEWDFHLDEDATHDVVMGAIGDFPKPYQNFLKALNREGWLGFDYPSQAVNEVINNPNIYKDFDIPPALKAAITKFENSAFKGEAFSDMPDLRVKLRSNPDLVDNFDEAIALIDDDLQGAVTPSPFKTYPDEGLEVFQPKGADVLKKRLVKKFALGDDIEGAEEVEKFIDVIGQRMFSDVGISVTKRIKAQGRYQWATNVVQLRKDVVESGGLERTAIHELWHSLSRYLPEGDLSKLTKEFKRERIKYIKSFGVEIDDAIEGDTLEDLLKVPTIKKGEVPDELHNFLTEQSFSEDNYRFRNIDEYFTELMTDEFLARSVKGEFDRGTDRTFRGIARDIAIILKDLFASIKSKLGISQQRKIFNDFLSQRNIVKQRAGAFDERPMFLRKFSEMPEFNKTVDSFLDQATAKGVRIGGKAAVKGVVKDLVKLKDGMTTGELAALQDAVADKLLEEGTAIKTLTKESLEEGGLAEFADLVGADGTVLDQFVEQAAKDTVTLNRVMSRMAAMQELMEANGQEIINAAKNFKESKAKLNPDELQSVEARLKGLMEQQLHIQAGHSSLASGFGRGLKSRQMRTKMSLSTDELQNKQVREEFLNKKGGLSMDQIVEGILIAEKNGGDDLFNTLIGVNKQVRGGHGGKMMDMVQEYYKNSLMWGPRTLTINALGTGLSNVWKNFERGVGGWVSADEATRRAVSNQWGETTSLMDAWKFLLNAWETGDQFIGDAGSAFVENSKSSIGSITGDNVQKLLRNAEIGDGLKEAIDYFGNVIRFPNRFNTSIDQFYKFIQYKGRALSELKLKAYDLGLRDPDKVAKYVHDTFEALVTRSNRNFSEGALFREAQEVVQGPFQNPAARQKSIADYVRTEKTNKLNKAREAGLIEGSLNDEAALEALTKNWIDPNIRAAEEVTFSGQLGELGQKVQNLVTSTPGGFLVAPFVRTPTNILKFSYDRISAPARAVIDKARASKAWATLEPGYRQRIEALQGGLKGSEEYRKTILEQLNATKPDGSPDRIARAEARGKVATGTILNASLFYAVNNFGDNITGGGPTDYKQKQAWMASGKLPYSIKVGDTWVSYQRLDPLATVIGIYADAKELSEDNKLTAANSDDLDKLMAVTFELGVRNVTDKSYLAGVNKFIKTLSGEGTFGKYAGGIAGGFIPNIIPQGSSITGDQHMNEVRGFADVVLKRIPGMDLDLKRNPLGEPVVKQYFEGVAGILNPLNPLAWGFDKDDKVAKELANVAHGFSPPSTKIAGIIELTEYTGENGRSAYDRMLDLQSKIVLNGMTQRQALSKLISDKRYKAIDPTSFVGLPSERVKYITRILSRYKKAAKNQMLREFPEIMQLQQQVEGSVRSGVSREDVLALLSQ